MESRIANNAGRLDVGWGELTEQPAAPHTAPALEPRRFNNLTLIDGKTFLATTLAGDISPASSADVGLFYRDTRFLSHWELRINGHRAVVLSSANQRNIRSQIELTTTNLLIRENLDLPENTLHIRREQVITDQFFDRLTFRNFNLRPVTINVEILFASDFLDVFQVRGRQREREGTYFEPLVRDARTVLADYLGLDELFRQTTIQFDPAPTVVEGHRAQFELALGPAATRVLNITVQPSLGRPPERIDTNVIYTDRPVHSNFELCLAHRRQRYADWERTTTSFESSDELFTRCLTTAMSDFFSLRVPFKDKPLPPDQARETAGGEIIAAGIPWFATIFGRDSLIAGYQSLMLHPQLAKETLRYLAQRQGREYDDWRDEEPGKILHEWRQGEMTMAGEVPHSPYYGSVDSTPLFLIVLDETYSWTGDGDLLEELLPAARRALAWMDEYGDLDHDGFVEYQHRSREGLDNQGWKDSWDAYQRADGSLPPPPLALCEVQGYCYDARYRASRLLRAAGDGATADRLRRQASELSRRFERQFWVPEIGYYAAALDGNKQPQRAITSNPGHLLWSRIASRDHARQVARRLMRGDMFSGWGVRTLSADEATYNPLSYHRGSIWPHDNSLIAQGLAFYDFKGPLLRILGGMFQAANYFRDQRLPELFAGVRRGDFDQPVNYPVSCSPQAWASGSWFLMLTAALGLRPNVGRHELRIVNPTLPDWLQWLRVQHLQLGASQVSLEFNRRGERTFCNVLETQGDRLNISVDFTPRLGPGV